MAEPGSRAFFPEPGRYLAHFPRIVEASRAAAQPHGSALVADDFSGAALWLPPGVSQDDAAVAAAVTEGASQEMLEGGGFAAFERLHEFHPEEPFWYLAVLGVDPRHQGRGVGRALLDHQLAVVDAAHTPAFLETANRRNVTLYERFGFEPLGDLAPPGQDWCLVPMLRKAR